MDKHTCTTFIHISTNLCMASYVFPSCKHTDLPFFMQIFIHVCVNVLFCLLSMHSIYKFHDSHANQSNRNFCFMQLILFTSPQPFHVSGIIQSQSNTEEIQWACTLHALNSQLMLAAGTPIMQSPSMISRQTPCTQAVCMFTHSLCEPSTSHACSISMLLNPT